MTFNFEATPEVAATGKSDVAPAAAGIADPIEPAPPRRRVLLVGQPNVGKSVVFGALTGTYVTVSNYPGTTVEITRGRAPFGEHVWEVVDTPGTHNLVPMTEDESVTRDILLSEPHDAVIQVGDAKGLSRTLLLTLQIAELGIPFCLDLNMLDEARSRGLHVDLAALARELPGVQVNASTATEGEGLDAVREYLASGGGRGEFETSGAAFGSAGHAGRVPLSCAPAFPPDVEAAITDIAAHLDTDLPVAKRAVATMLLGGERGIAAGLDARVGEQAKGVAREHARALARAHGVPAFALLSRLRLARAQAITRMVQSRDTGVVGRAHEGHVGFAPAAALAAGSALAAAVTYAGAMARVPRASASDPLADYGFFDVVARVFSRDLFVGWNLPTLGLLAIATALGTLLVRRHARLRSAAWKLVGAFAFGWFAYFVASVTEWLSVRAYSPWPVHLGAAAGVLALGLAAAAGDRQDANLSRVLGRAATHPLWGLPIVGLVLLLAYKIVGSFGAGTAVDFVENHVFGSSVARVALDAAESPTALAASDVADNGAKRLVAVADGPSRVDVFAQIKTDGVYVADRTARIDVYAGKARGMRVTQGDARAIVEGDVHGAEARIWSGYVNRVAYALFAWIGVPILTAFFVGPYGILTMGVTYAVAIVLPVVTTFFFVFSVLEDSGYLPRLAVMSNRVLQSMGLNGKAVLPMVLGLGCDTMATLTARILETKKERMLVTLLLALGVPCSSQLSVIFALMQRTSAAATFVWVGVVIGTLLCVGWVAARVLPGDKSDFLLEMPPIRQPMVSNILAKTMARIEWYLKEAVPLFLLGTALLFVLDAFNLLVFVHRAGEPVVHYMLGFPRTGAVSDRVSEALLVGFLRRDFGAAGLLDLARAGRLSSADVAVSMVTITLFIPCIANVFMIARERGWKTAGAMSAFIFPYAVAVGAVVRAGFRAFGG